MKIGLVCPYDIFSPGGVREHILALYREFIKKGHQVKIIASETRKSKNPKFLLLGRSTKFPSLTGSWARISASFNNKEIEKILSREKFDILHFHEPLVPFLTWQTIFASRSVNIATFHSAWEEGIFPMANFEFLIKLLAEVFEKKIDGLIAVSSSCKKCWQKFFKKEMTIISNGIDLSRFNTQIEPIKKYQDEKINLLFVGRFEKRKGAIYLLRAFEKIQNKKIRLILVGEGPRKIEPEVYLKTHNLKNIEFVGKISDAELPRYYATADICCFPSIGGESFGIVLLEAMASGKPVVCFANPGYKEVLKNYPFKKALVKVGDVDGLATALKVLVKDPDLRKKLSQWSLKEVQKYSWPKIAQQVLEYYQQWV